MDHVAMLDRRRIGRNVLTDLPNSRSDHGFHCCHTASKSVTFVFKSAISVFIADTLMLGLACSPISDPRRSRLSPWCSAAIWIGSERQSGWESGVAALA